MTLGDLQSDQQMGKLQRRKRPSGSKPKNIVARIFDKVFYKITAAVLVILLIWCLLPAVVANIYHIGVWFPVVVILVLLVAITLRHRIAIWKKGKLKIPICFARTVIVLSLLAFVGTSAWMLSAAAVVPQENATAIVMGAQVQGRTPSLSLVRRLDKAVEYLQANPGAMCIVSGGQGEGEDISEALAMAIYLTERGIDPQRIYMEPESKNTQENIANSAEIIREQGLNENVAIVTDTFHQLRCSIQARANGLQPGAYACSSDWWLLPCYWVREMFALAKTILL